MKKITQSIITIFILAAGLSGVYAQDTTKAVIRFKADSTVKDDSSLQGQYQSVLSRSKSMNGYKLVNPYRLSAFWKNVSDTLATKRKELARAKTQISSQALTIDTLKTQIAGKENTLINTNAKLDEISLLGLPLTRSTYSLIVWSLIIVLALALTFVVIRSAKHVHEAKYRSGLYEEIAQEYQNYKIKANDKEKKLARELQDERNRLEELKNRG